ncbi:MAG TPA: DUF2281 domain-containing protein [Thermoanaerobaculia bacterium]|nr:DUF2281 domain-containing protein [Thermoanaerobaculia bacterium]
MTIADDILKIATALPTDRQQELLDFAEFLRARERSVQEGGRTRLAGPFAGMPYFMADDFDEPLPDSFWLGEGQRTAP